MTDEAPNGDQTAEPTDAGVEPRADLAPADAGAEDTATRFSRLRFEAQQTFRPNTPVATRELFAGRAGEIQKVLDAVSRPGQHVILFGERGVGKTSLANVIEPVLGAVAPGAHVVIKANCSKKDTFGSMWRQALGKVTTQKQTATPGFANEVTTDRRTLADDVPAEPTPSAIQKVLERLGKSVFIFDEFDRMTEGHEAFTDLIKSLSDHDTPVTIVLVGVADTVEQLIEHHASIDRAMVQIHMPRMGEQELHEILAKGAEQLEVEFLDGTADRIVVFSHGLPHFTHLLGLEAVCAAFENERLRVTAGDLEAGVERAVDATRQHTKTLYHQATASAREDALFPQVLLACALAKRDPLSYFRSADVAVPLGRIMGGDGETPSFSRHLREFCSPERGPVLARAGERQRYRYRFTNPVLEPYVIMRGLADKLITEEDLAALKG